MHKVPHDSSPERKEPADLQKQKQMEEAHQEPNGLVSRSAIAGRFFSVGVELFSGFLVAFGLSWALGLWLDFPVVARIIGGTVLGLAHCGLLFYRLAKGGARL